MPNYKKSKKVREVIEVQEVKPMIDRATQQSNKVLIALAYITGARPAELVTLRKRDFKTVAGDIQIALPTKKGGYPRTLPLSIEKTPFLTDLVLPYVEGLQSSESRLFNFGTVRVWQIIDETSEHRPCPYSFRHSRLTRLSMDGASEMQLIAWKGAKNSSSVRPYLHVNPRVLAGLKDKVA